MSDQVPECAGDVFDPIAFDALLVAWLAGELDAAGEAALTAALEQHPEAAVAFASGSALTTALQQRVPATLVATSAQPVAVGWVMAAAAAVIAAVMIGLQSTAVIPAPVEPSHRRVQVQVTGTSAVTAVHTAPVARDAGGLIHHHDQSIRIGFVALRRTHAQPTTTGEP